MLRVDFHSLGPQAARDIKSWTSISSAFKDLPCIYHGSFCWELIRIVNRYYNRVLEQQNSSIFFFKFGRDFFNHKLGFESFVYLVGDGDSRFLHGKKDNTADMTSLRKSHSK
jgi:hypothetical protein